jgi:predicted dehydrogenase
MVVDSWRASRQRAGGGVVLMNSIHQIDAVRFVTGLEVVRAAGEVATFAEGVEVEDTAGAVLRLTGGAIATVTAAAHSHGAHDEETISIDCVAGRIDLPDPYGPAPLRVFEPGSGRAWVDSPAAAHRSHEDFLRSFTTSVRERAAPPATVWDAVAALAVVEAIYTSAQGATAIEVERYTR